MPGRSIETDVLPAGRTFCRTAVLLLSASLLWLRSSHAEDAQPAGKETLDTEHIFGFTEGAYIGDKGEKELENTATDRFGKFGSYDFIENETAFRYVNYDNFRVSLGGLLNGYAIHDVPGTAGHAGFDFGGMTTEFRWQPVEHTKDLPIDFTLSLSPQWRRIDDLSGAQADNYALQTAALFDAALIPKKFFVAFNAIYQPSVTRLYDAWQHNSSLELSLAASYAVTADVFLGVEARHLSGGDQGLFAAQALYFGPSAYFKLSDTLAIKVAWSEQVPDETTHRLDLVTFERHQALFLLVKSF